MVRIICRALDCAFWDDGLCSSDEITYDPDEGCLTYEIVDDVIVAGEDEVWDDGDDINPLLNEDDDDLYDDELDDMDLYEADEEDLYEDDDNW